MTRMARMKTLTSERHQIQLKWSAPAEVSRSFEDHPIHFVAEEPATNPLRKTMQCPGDL